MDISRISCLYEVPKTAATADFGGDLNHPGGHWIVPAFRPSNPLSLIRTEPR
jgi:hypothetical protein